jgi:hypothetical protein
MQTLASSSLSNERSCSGTWLGSHARYTEASDTKKAINLIQNYTIDVFGRINREENIANIM